MTEVRYVVISARFLTNDDEFVTQPGCVCRENVIVLFAQKSQVKDTPKIARSKIGKPELPLNVRSNSPFSPQTYTLKPRWTRHLLKETTL